jgi:hypothetical protein
MITLKNPFAKPPAMLSATPSAQATADSQHD